MNQALPLKFLLFKPQTKRLNNAYWLLSKPVSYILKTFAYFIFFFFSNGTVHLRPFPVIWLKLITDQ